MLNIAEKSLTPVIIYENQINLTVRLYWIVSKIISNIESNVKEAD